MSSSRHGRYMSADEEKAYDSSIHRRRENGNVDSSARLPYSASSRTAHDHRRIRSRSRSPYRANKPRSRSPYRADRKRSRSPYRAGKDRSKSPHRTSLEKIGEKRRHDGDQYSSKNASDPRRFKTHYEDDVLHEKNTKAHNASAYAGTRGRIDDKHEHGKPQQRLQSRSSFQHVDSAETSSSKKESLVQSHFDRPQAAKPYQSTVNARPSDQENVDNSVSQDPSTTEMQLSDAEIIEQRRRRREAIKAKHRAQPTLLVQALEPKLSPGPSTPVLQSPLDLSNPGSPSSVLQSPQTPDAASTLGSPRPLMVDSEEEMLKRTTNGDSPTEQQGPSAADYDPSMDMQEDRRDLIKTDANTVLQPSAIPEVINDSRTTDVDMFADDDDMFADAPAPRVHGTAQAKTLDQSLLDNWDYPDGHIRVIIGELLDGKYAIKQQIGKGTFATVVRAEETSTGRAVAIKIACNNDTMHKAGTQEMDFLTVLNGSDPDDKRHIIRLLAHFEHKGHLCLVFENLHADLRETLKKHGRNVGLNLIALRSFAYSMFQALLHMQRNEILHADLKPDNILISERMNQLKVCDFGTASKLKDAEVTPYLVSRFYRAPEVMLGIPLDFAIDMWSIGCTLFELYTGRILFTGGDNNQMLRSIQECRGKIPVRMLKKATLAEKHFDEFGNFVSVERDRITGQISYRQPNLTKIAPKKVLRSRILDSTPGDDPSSTNQIRDFIDLIEKCLQLDPLRRISPTDALRHPFVAHKVANSTQEKKRPIVLPALAPSSIR